MRPAAASRITAPSLALLAALPARAWAQDVTFQGSVENMAARVTTLRVPATGTFTLPSVSNGLLLVNVAITGIAYRVDSVTWNPTGAPAQALVGRAGRIVGAPMPGCVVELWATKAPTPGPGYATIRVAASSGAPPAPSLNASLMVYGNAGSISTDGPCCMNVSNDGNGTSTITKTFGNNSRSDLLVDAVCIAWTGTDPSTPRTDTAANPEHRARVVQLIRSPNLFLAVGESLGAAVDPPMTSFRHMRWVQSGTRDWALAGLILTPAPPPPPPPDASAAPDSALTADAPPDLAPPADAGPPPPPAVDAAPLPDAAPPLVPDGPPPADEAPASSDAASGPTFRQVDLRVGCACRAAGRPGGSWLVVLVALALARRRRRCLSGTSSASGSSPRGACPRGTSGRGRWYR